MKYISLHQIQSVIGQEAFQKLIKAFPGGRIYLHKNFINREERNREIISAYDAGASREELAAAFNLSISTIDIIKNSRVNRKM